MSLNWKEIDRVREEWSLDSSFLQEIRQYDFHHILFQFYSPAGKTTLLVSLKQGSLRIHKTERKRKALARPPRFTTFLKARLKGGKVLNLEQIGSERILLFTIGRSHEIYHLYIKLWENSSNIIVTDENHKILDCFSRRPKRKEVPGEFFNPKQNFSAPPDPDRFTVRDFEGDGDYNRRLELYYDSLEKDGELTKLRDEAARCLKAERRRLAARQDRLDKRVADYGQGEKYKLWGDEIMSHLHLIKPGDKSLEITTWTEDGEEQVTLLELDPRLTGVENGERYYKRYKKARTGEKLAQEERDQLIRRLEKIDGELERLPEQEDREHLKTLITLEKERKTKNDSPTPGLQFHSGPFLILVGRNAGENDELLRHHVRGNDLWLHSRDWPGGYIFIKTIKGKSVPLDTLLDAGNLAVHYSRGKKSGKCDLYYTEVKYLRRAKGAPKGTVLPTREKNLTVEPDPIRLARLTGRGERSN
ncbi:MAG: NFACT family protein [Spirochaetales bacterium]|nr:NFACT family protein [Spirochaetales bacterium]